MFIVRIDADADAEQVLTALQDLGKAWLPASDIPRFVCMDGGVTEDEIRAVPGVAWCAYEHDLGRLKRPSSS